MESAVDLALLEFALRRSFEPLLRITVRGLSGKPPWRILQWMLPLVSPPIPRLMKPGNLFWVRGERAGRASLSIDESPIKQSRFSMLWHWMQWCSNLPPHVRRGLDRFMWLNGRELTMDIFRWHRRNCTLQPLSSLIIISEDVLDRFHAWRRWTPLRS